MPTIQQQKLKLLNNTLVTAKILYRLPDYRSLLQTFVWQHDDLAPDLPRLHEFLEFWGRNLDGPIHSVHYCHVGLVHPAELHFPSAEFRLH